MCIGWCTNRVTLRNARCNHKDNEEFSASIQRGTFLTFLGTNDFSRAVLPGVIWELANCKYRQHGACGPQTERDC